MPGNAALPIFSRQTVEPLRVPERKFTPRLRERSPSGADAAPRPCPLTQAVGALARFEFHLRLPRPREWALHQPPPSHPYK